MTLLNPLLWGGLLLAAAPILIHLLARRRLKRQPFSTLDFLKRLQTKRMRNLRVRQWLLLLLRTLAVLLLAFAFLRPVLSDQSGLGAGSSESVLLVDLSASMVARGDEGATPLDKMREAIRELWSGMETVSLVVMDEEGNRDIATRSSGDESPAWVERLTVDGRPESIASGWKRASDRLRQSGAATRELIVLSDFASTLEDSLPELPEGVRVYHVNLGNRARAANAWVNGVRFNEAVLRSGSTATLEIEGMLTGSDEPLRVMVTVSLGGRRVAEGEIELQPGGPSTVSFHVQVPEAGFHDGEVTLELNDALAADNRYPFALHVPGKRRVLLTGEDVQALRYMELALNPEGHKAAFDLTLRPGQVRGADLGNVDVVLLAGWQSPDAATARQLAQFVQDGGGLWLLLDERSDLGAFSRTLLAEVGFAPVSDDRGRAETRSQWEDLDLNHPALRTLFSGAGRFDRPSVSRLYTAREGEGDRVLIRVSDGRPFLLERAHGEGRVWWTPSAVDRAWTDWPISGVFAPLAQQGISYLAGDAGNSVGEVSCGEAIVWQIPVEGEGRGAEAHDPLGNTIPASPEFRQGRRAWVTTATHWPGQYRLVVNGVERELAAVRFPHSESNLLWGVEPEWAGERIVLQENESYGSALERFRTGRELSATILVAVLLLLVAETLVARERRPRGDSVAEGRAA